MPTATFDDRWFFGHRARLLRPAARCGHQPYDGIVRSLLTGSRLQGRAHKHTETALKRLAPRHAATVRAHMQLYRACLETLGFVPSDAIVSAAAQIEWLWYVTPFKGFYRDHLAHVMKVALTGIWLLEETASPLAAGKPLLDRLGEELAAGILGSDAIRGAARWCRIPEEDLARPGFWKAAVTEAVRIAGLLHDLAYPDVMSAKIDHAAGGVRVHSPREEGEAQLARWAVETMNDHLVMAPFHAGRLPWWQPMRPESRRTAELLFQESHSLRGAHTLLGFMESTHRVAPLDPFERFVREWAALAISLHDYDKLFELPGKKDVAPGSGAAEMQRWAEQPENRSAIRPRFQDDPVSYLVALADQLQDFGRMFYDQTTPHPDQVSLEVRYPCQSVTLSAEGDVGALKGRVRFDFGGERKPFTATEGDVSRARRSKLPPGKPEPIFSPDGWLDHSGLFDRLNVEVVPAPAA